MNNIKRIEELNKIIRPMALFWDAYLKDKKRDQYEDFWQWGYKRVPQLQAVMEAAYKLAFINGKEVYLAPREIYHPHTPVVEEDYALFALRLDRCQVCRQPMISENHWMLFTDQAKRAGIKRDAHLAILGERQYVCVECAEKGRLEFRCRICDEKRTTDLLWSDSPPDAPVCTVCYEKTPAKQWDELIRHLNGDY